MSLEREITHVMRETQERIFRVCQARGLTLKAISVDSGIPYSTMRSYAGQNGSTAIMGVDALYKLVGVVPDELLSLMLPEGRAIVSVPTDIDHDEIERRCRDYLAVKGRAHRQDSPDGPAISLCEQTSLNTHAGFLRAVA